MRMGESSLTVLSGIQILTFLRGGIERQGKQRNMAMDAHLLPEIFPTAKARESKELHRLFTSLESLDSLFYGIVHIDEIDNRGGYFSSSTERVLGYPPDNFSGGSGLKFFYSITQPEYFPQILEREAYYVLRAKDPDFDIRGSQVMEINGGLKHRDGTPLRIRHLSVVLEYSTARDFLVSLCTWQKIDHLNELQLEESKSVIAGAFSRIKEIYARIFPEKFQNSAPPGGEPVKLLYPPFNVSNVTKKEREVLKLIADGLSSRQIADRLCISIHTAESHRRNLLEKFDAKNVAELIKKATKVYWLE